MGKEYRGVRTTRYTYVRDLHGPWLLFDNIKDPYQMNNLVGSSAAVGIQAELEARVQEMLRLTGDEFLPSMEYIARWGYPVGESGTVPYSD